MIIVIKGIISVLMSILSLFSSCIFGNFTARYEPVDADNIMLCFAAISDVHMTESFFRKSMLELGLYDMENADALPDALVVSGDLTDNGQREEYDALAGVFSKYKPAKNIILAEGNHDTWTQEDNYDEAEKLFIEYNKKISDRDIDKAYYSVVINGYSFIVLASETDWTFAYISDEQLEWLDGEMEKASHSGLPIFVVTHWPLNQTHGLPYTWGYEDDMDAGGFGYQSEEIEKILKKYNNVFMISGHVHNGFTNDNDARIYGYNSVESDGSFHSINLPSYMYMTTKGRISNGTGYQFEVYNDKVVIRARSFSAGIWYTMYDYSFDLV